MVKKLNWNELFVKEFKYRAGMFNFMFLTFNAKSYKSDKTKCSKCCNSQHKMETILFECKASECNYNYKCVHEVRYKVIHCMETQKYSFFILNKHPSDWKCDDVKLSDQKGMTPKVKRLVEHLYFDCEIGRPKVIEQKIHNKY